MTPINNLKIGSYILYRLLTIKAKTNGDSKQGKFIIKKIKRYSDLRDIHEAIKNIKKNIPEFPKRKLFGITNDNP